MVIFYSSSSARCKYKNKLRISVSRSRKNLYAQLIDDVAGKTLIGFATNGRDIKVSSNKSGAAILGKKFAEACISAGVVNGVYMDRRGRKYAGVLSSFADAAREAGLKF